jgi:hypothetical protein
MASPESEVAKTSRSYTGSDGRADEPRDPVHFSSPSRLSYTDNEIISHSAPKFLLICEVFAFDCNELPNLNHDVDVILLPLSAVAPVVLTRSTLATCLSIRSSVDRLGSSKYKFKTPSA